MSAIELLVTFAELSVSYIGFASIVAAIQSLGQRSWSLFDKMLFRTLIEISVVGVFLGLLPVTLTNARLEPSTVWTISSSVALFVGVSANIVRVHQNRRFVGHQPKVARFVALPLSVTAHGLNLVNIIVWRTATAYVFVLLITVTIASATFLALVFRLFPLAQTDRPEGES